ncbi:hypothetical protein KSP40_PGU001424 [Platanthera guangdongensis]|uniref:Uncharacterized protein n=1 Tax=Platanthera guangdongensis TaxID=2320717 RepID=A0ABR2MRN6_9ASPA
MGGGVIRAAAKAAVSGAFRSPFSHDAGRRIARQQVSSLAPTVEPGHFVPSLSAGHERAEAAAVSVATHWPEFEFDEWELAGGKEENIESVDIAPRLIFGPVPTLEEAEGATTDLKDALENGRGSRGKLPLRGSGGSAPGKFFIFHSQLAQTLSYPGLANKSPAELAYERDEIVGLKRVFSIVDIIDDDSKLIFYLQVVASSLASDKNVWDAVMNNEKVVQFLENPLPAFAEIHEQPAESVAENESADEFSPTVQAKETSGNSFLKKVQIKISQMVIGISEFVKDFFGISIGDSSSSNDKSGSSATDNTKAALGASFFAVAVGVICVILLKRI